jgi:hypothetical protein
MADKRECPACWGVSSTILDAYLKGYDCPNCGLPAHASAAIEKARDHHVEEETLARLASVETQLAQTLRENERLRGNIEAARAALT